MKPNRLPETRARRYPDAFRGALALIESACRISIDLDDAKEKVNRVLRSLDQPMTYGTLDLIDSEDSITTTRELLEYLSSSQDSSIAAIRDSYPPERLERIRRRYPYWSKFPRKTRAMMGLVCNQRKSDFRCSVNQTTIRVEFSDGSVYSLDLQSVPEEQLQWLAIYRPDFRTGWRPTNAERVASMVDNERTAERASNEITEDQLNDDLSRFLSARMCWPIDRTRMAVDRLDFEQKLLLSVSRDSTKVTQTIERLNRRQNYSSSEVISARRIFNLLDEAFLVLEVPARQ